MKELSIKEKAKRYDEAIKRAQAKMEEAKVFDYDDEQTAHTIRLTTTDIFPELKESEDERIRKEMIEILKKEAHDFPSSVIAEKSNSWIAYLEKQGEQKPADTEKGAKGNEREIPNSAWSEEDESMLYGVMETEQYMLDVVNGIKKFDVGNASIKEDCTRELNWLKYLKDRVQPQPKQEWGEEDEELMKWSIINLTELKDRFGEEYGKVGDCIDWLKSLRPQKQCCNDVPSREYILNVWELGNYWKELTNGVCNTEHGTQLEYIQKHWKEGDYYDKISVCPQKQWKPSEEQMEALSIAMCGVDDPLFSLYQDLKKLKG